MAHISLNLRGLPTREKVALARRIFTAMKHNPTFPNPDPPLVVLDRLANELEVPDGEPSLEKNEALLDETLGRLATYVQNTSGGSATIISAAGMNVDDHHHLHGALPKPANVSISLSDSDSGVRLRCDPVPDAKTYVFQSTPDPITDSSDWLIGSVSTGPGGTITSLTPGHRYWFRVSAVGPTGQGPWSDPLAAEVP